MEIINELSSLLTNELNAVKRLNDAFMELNRRLAKEAKLIDRLDTIARIDELKSRLVSEVNHIQQKEKNSERVSNAGKVYSGLLGFAAGSIIGKILKQENPVSSGYKLFSKELEKKSPFGIAMMALKEGRKIDDIEVIAISRLAREAKTTEAEIISSLKYQGYSLITHEEFWLSLNHVKEAIKEGKS